MPITRVGGGGGYFHIGYVPRERPPWPALNFRSGAYHFHKLQKNPLRSITILHFWRILPFRRPSFSNFFNFNPFIAFQGRLSRVNGRSGDSHFHAQNGSARSGAPHFHAQNGSSSFRSPAFSSSKQLKLVPEPHIFTLDREFVPEPLPIFHFAAAHTYQNLG